MINFFFFCALIFRFITLFISIRNEKILRKNGAIEHGAKNSKILSIAHIFFYISCITEANIRGAVFDKTSAIGLGILIFSLIMLFFVIRSLGQIWTVKIFILRNHKIVETPLFRLFRHPNYFLNIAPELVGLSLLCHAFYTAAIGLPVYAVILAVRIIQEERAMKFLRRS